MPSLRQTLSYLILGQRGGRNRIRVIDLLAERPHNLHQLAEAMGVNYRTARHHVDVLQKAGVVGAARAGGEGLVYGLTPQMESQIALFHEIAGRQARVGATPGFFQGLVEGTSNSIVMMDDTSEVFFWNRASETLYGYSGKEVLGKKIPVFADAGRFAALMDRLARGGRVSSLRTRVRHKSGQEMDVYLSMERIEDDAGRPAGCSMLSLNCCADGDDG